MQVRQIVGSPVLRVIVAIQPDRTETKTNSIRKNIILLLSTISIQCSVLRRIATSSLHYCIRAYFGLLASTGYRTVSPGLCSRPTRCHRALVLNFGYYDRGRVFYNSGLRGWRLAVNTIRRVDDEWLNLNLGDVADIS